MPRTATAEDRAIQALEVFGELEKMQRRTTNARLMFGGQVADTPVKLYVTEREAQAIKDTAQGMGLSVSSFLRLAAVSLSEAALSNDTADPRTA